MSDSLSVNKKKKEREIIYTKEVCIQDVVCMSVVVSVCGTVNQSCPLLQKVLLIPPVSTIIFVFTCLSYFPIFFFLSYVSKYKQIRHLNDSEPDWDWAGNDEWMNVSSKWVNKCAYSIYAFVLMTVAFVCAANFISDWPLLWILHTIRHNRHNNIRHFERV